jgi:hypothetical protein
MTTVELIKELLRPNKNVKEQIEQLLKEAYIGIQELHKMSMDKSLTLDFITSIEQLFIKNQFNIEELHLPKYLKNYAQNLNAFWTSCSYYNHTQHSRGEFYLFESLKKNDLPMMKHYSESEMIFVLRKLEDYWIASNQVYTKYEISLIRKEYIR